MLRGFGFGVGFRGLKVRDAGFRGSGFRGMGRGEVLFPKTESSNQKGLRFKFTAHLSNSELTNQSPQALKRGRPYKVQGPDLDT